MTAEVAFDPFGVDVMTDPYPVYRELRVAHRVVELPQYDAFALTRFDDVWRVLTDRDRFSIFEGPVFHREALLRHHDGPPDTTVSHPVTTFSMLDPPAHTELRQALLGPFRPRAVAPLEATVRRFARERSSCCRTGRCSTCATTTRRRWRRRSRRCSSGSRSKTRSSWSAG